MGMPGKKQYAAPQIITHQPIVFETALSTSSCPGGHWEFQLSPSGFWQRVCVKD
ncbi:hypothetical protein ACFQI7_32895 [Paenibacillus allorhizosphaerae]|uniref:Uncharacterized protein n=1 Tax=Paenibacillus allorhizosphaerae TaxID=2849866 RepID=A0ABN7TWX7_9BACL|nr:hypothetical protein [Paenibacillus allorhizosphaerae]CAG7655044.1 hypothetical protein PAECIP111802_05992 [Paenibacillus allorhizosphaerae]